MAKVVSAVRKASVAAAPAMPTEEQRYQMIAEAAYYIAERRGFTNGNPEDDWFEAEAQVDRALGASTPRH